MIVKRTFIELLNPKHTVPHSDFHQQNLASSVLLRVIISGNKKAFEFFEFFERIVQALRPAVKYFAFEIKSKILQAIQLSKVFKMIQSPQTKDAIKTFDRLDSDENAQIPFGLDSRSETKAGLGEDDRLRLRRKRTIPQDKARKSVVEAVVTAIESTVGNRVYELQVLMEDDSVIVEVTAPSFYVRQLVEHKSRSVVAEYLNKKFVPRVVVRN